jgi:hypothetical protein
MAVEEAAGSREEDDALPRSWTESPRAKPFMRLLWHSAIL